MEATAGKNPVNHIGKLYSIFAFQLANKIYEKFNFKNQIRIVGRIGNDISDPLAISIMVDRKFRREENYALENFIEESLPEIKNIQEQILNDKIQIF